MQMLNNNRQVLTSAICLVFYNPFSYAQIFFPIFQNIKRIQASRRKSACRGGCQAKIIPQHIRGSSIIQNHIQMYSTSRVETFFTCNNQTPAVMIHAFRLSATENWAMFQFLHITLQNNTSQVYDHTISYCPKQHKHSVNRTVSISFGLDHQTTDCGWLLR